MNKEKLVQLYVKAELLWDKIPTPFKIPVYYLLLSAILLACDQVIDLKLDIEAWQTIFKAFVANEVAIVINIVKAKLVKLEELKKEYMVKMES